MYRFLLLLSPVLLCLATPPLAAEKPDAVAVAADDWPWWRGPTRNGVAAKQKVPLTWAAGVNVLWQTPVPGRGHGSPIVVGDRVFLATADEDRQAQSLLCYDRRTGKRLWQTEVHQGDFVKGGNRKKSDASSTPACDGHRVFINFLHGGAVYTTALSLDGRKLWQTKISDYVIHQGYGSSPAVYGSLVLVSADNKGGGRSWGWSEPRAKSSGRSDGPRRRIMPHRSSCPSRAASNS